MISVIVPVYNVEKYLEGCVRSILAQTYRELEVILVNDGSTDSSLSICHALAAEDSRIRVLDGPNGGVSSARNRGLDAARGEYIAFVDSDDTIAPEMYAKLLAAMESIDADIAECGFVYEPENGKASWSVSLGHRTAETREECIRQYAFFENTANGPCNKLYRRETVGEHRFPAYAQAEDALFNMRVILNCRRKITVSDCLYHYLQRAESGGHMSRPGHERDAILAWNEICRMLEGISIDLCTKVYRKRYDVVVRQYTEQLRRSRSVPRELWRQLKQDYITAYSHLFTADRPMTARQRIGFALFRVSPRAYFQYVNGRKESI